MDSENSMELNYFIKHQHAKWTLRNSLKKQRNKKKKIRKEKQSKYGPQSNVGFELIDFNSNHHLVATKIFAEINPIFWYCMYSFKRNYLEKLNSQ